MSRKFASEVRTCMRGHHLHVDTWFSSIDHKVSTFDPDVRKMTQSEKFELQRSSQRKFQSVFTTHARIRPSDHCKPVPCPFKLSRVFQPYSSNSTVPGQFSEGYSIVACMAMLLYRVKFFIGNFSICVIFQNRCQTWSIYGLWRKMMYYNVDEKKSANVCVNYVTIQWWFDILFVWPIFITSRWLLLEVS